MISKITVRYHAFMVICHDLTMVKDNNLLKNVYMMGRKRLWINLRDVLGDGFQILNKRCQ